MNNGKIHIRHLRHVKPKRNNSVSDSPPDVTD